MLQLSSNHSSQPIFIQTEFVVQLNLYSVFQKSDAKIEITITATNLIRIKYPLSSFNYHLSGANVANFNKIHRTVFEQQLFNKKLSGTNRKLIYNFLLVIYSNVPPILHRF